MVAKIHALGRSFAGVAKYCLHDAPEPDEAERLESADRVEWAETRNLASRPERAAGQMAATTQYAGELKRLAGGSQAGRPLAKPGPGVLTSDMGKHIARRLEVGAKSV